jgi:integrase
MACLEMRTGSKWWYGRWRARNQLFVRNLDIEIEGERPSSVNKTSDRRFEASRAKAQAKLNELVEQSKSRRAEELVQTLHEIRTGTRISTIALDKLYDRWGKIPRRKGHLSEVYRKLAESVFARFRKFLAEQYPDVQELGQVSHAMAVAFMVAEESRGIAGRTRNATLGLLKGTFLHLRREGGFIDNPFEGIVTKDEETIHRKPFSAEEIRAIVDVAQKDELCRPLIITGLCTAMRRGDVCQLKWADVNLVKRMISVKTAKTGERVWIPIFPLLFDELAKLPHNGEYCFPEAARLYQEKAEAINRRLNAVFRAAGFVELDKDGEVRSSGPNIVAPEALAKARTAIEQVDLQKFTRKVRENLLRVFDLYAAGLTIKEIIPKLGMSKGSVSTYLSRIEQIVGFAIVRTAKASTPHPAGILGYLHEKREGSKRRVNVHGFHALRSTFVTLALVAGVPVELVKAVTGHTLTETVIAHYFRPNQEQMRAALQAAMPKLLTNGAPTREEQVRQILDGMTAKTWKRDRDTLRGILDAGNQKIPG